MMDVRRWATALWLPALLTVVWEAAARLGWLSPLFFPPPSSLIPAAVRLWKLGELPLHLGATAERFGLGMLIGCALGIPAGILMGSVRAARTSLEPTFAALYTLPKIALLPLLMLILGIGESPRLTLVSAAAFLTMALQLTDAAKAVAPLHLDIARSCRAGAWLMFRRIYLPASMPQLITGLRLSVSRALLAAISVEFISCPEGIGSMLNMAWQTFAPDKLYLGIVIVALFGILANAMLRAAEVLLVPWSAKP
ncbi:MAG: ABC transporter permease [Acidobacteria bacterium]|nr:ABC transporter permease [Acidobacteriota bacterium]